MGIFGYLIHQNLGANFGMPESGYRSQKQPVLSPAYQLDATIDID